MPSINTEILKSILISYPPLSEQRAIAAVLSSLDDKIDLLHRQNKTLEAMAETLFRQWFVEEAKEDWEEGKISNLIEFNPKRQLSKGTIAPYLEMASLSTSTFNPDSWYNRKFSSGTKFLNGDTLLARITPCLENGKTAYVTFLDNDQVGWGSTEYIVMRSRDKLHPFFSYTLARNAEFREYAKGCLAGSSGRQRVEINHLMNYKIKIPPDNILLEFNEFAESIVPKLRSNSDQIRTLEKLRDTLLPKLMSGEVRVSL
jgi:type I restriction enzyme S subunit